MRTTCAPRSTQAPVFGGVSGIALSRRMTATRMWGVSDPLRAGRGRGRGQPNGVAHAPQAPCSAATAARTSKPAAQSAAGARLEVADQQEDRAAMVVKKVMPAVDSLIDSCITHGNGAP